MRQLSRHRPARGLTLIELAVGMVITVLLMGMAAPYFGDFVQQARLRQSGDTLLAEALYAQSEAIKRNATVRLKVAGGQIQVIDMSGGGDGVQLHQRVLPGDIGIGETEVTVNFGSRGTPLPWGQGASMNLGKSGLTCSAEMRCPGLRIDGGGGVRLCANQLSCS